MGCSASRLDTLIAKAIEDPSFTSSSRKPKTRSLSTPLVHHPAINKGDTHHLVSLTSTTYGLLNNHNNINKNDDNNKNNECFSGENDDFLEKLSPDSVINAWELMEGLEDVENDVGFNDFRVKSVNLCDFDYDCKLPGSKLRFNLVDSENLCDFNDAHKLPESKLGSNFVDCSSDFRVESEKLCGFNDDQKLPVSKLGLDFVGYANLCDFNDARKSSVSKSGLNFVGCGGDYKVNSVNLCDFDDARKSSVSKSGMHFVSCGGDYKVKSVNLCDYNDGHSSSVPKSGMNFVGYGSYGGDNNVKSLPGLKSGTDLVGCGGGDFKVNYANMCDFDDVQKLPVLKSGMNFVGYGGDYKRNATAVCDFKGVEKLSDSRLGLNLVDCSSDFKLMSSNVSDFNDAQKRPALGLGLNCTDSMMKLSDSYVFVDSPNEIVEEEAGFELSPSTKPLWKHLSEESLLSKMDPYVGNAYDKALSAKRFRYDQSRTGSKSLGSSPLVSKSRDMGSYSPVVLKLRSVIDNSKKLHVCEDKIMLYFTSLRGIRKTYEDCSTVRMILKGFRVVVDERDISMDSSYRKELQSALVGKPMSLPQLFIRGKHIGGADDVKLLHETGELERILEGCPTNDSGSMCQSCGDARFVPCSNCYGSRKVFQEEEGQMRKCPDCNENGLVRCPGCCP